MNVLILAGVTIATVTESNGLYKVTFTNGKAYSFNASTGIAREYVYVDPFNYGNKIKATLEAGDYISIGTENFKVISNTNGTILEMPYKIRNRKFNSNKPICRFGILG